MEPHEELAGIYGRQAERARTSGRIVAYGGGIATLMAAIVAAMLVPEGGGVLNLLGTGGAGAALTAALYAAVSALETHAEARAARHSALVPEDETVTP